MFGVPNPVKPREGSEGPVSRWQKQAGKSAVCVGFQRVLSEVVLSPPTAFVKGVGVTCSDEVGSACRRAWSPPLT